MASHRPYNSIVSEDAALYFVKFEKITSKLEIFSKWRKGNFSIYTTFHFIRWVLSDELLYE